MRKPLTFLTNLVKSKEIINKLLLTIKYFFNKMKDNCFNDNNKKTNPLSLINYSTGE